jgi:hypothetical protein
LLTDADLDHVLGLFLLRENGREISVQTSGSWQRERCWLGYSRFSTEYGPIAFDLIGQKDFKAAAFPTDARFLYQKVYDNPP